MPAVMSPDSSEPVGNLYTSEIKMEMQIEKCAKEFLL